VCERCELAQFGEIYAYGDTREDLDLLQLATRPYYCGEPMT
jgi:phosphoserine phosphatase